MAAVIVAGGGCGGGDGIVAAVGGGELVRAYSMYASCRVGLAELPCEKL